MKNRFYILILLFLFQFLFTAGIFNYPTKIETADFTVSLFYDPELGPQTFQRDIKDVKDVVKYRLEILPIKIESKILGWEAYVFKINKKGEKEGVNLLTAKKTNIKTVSPYKFLGWDLSSEKGSVYTNTREFAFEQVRMTFHVLDFQMIEDGVIESLKLQIKISPR